MFRIGGSATGITSGLDTPRKNFENGTDPYDRALKTTTRAMEDLEKFKGQTSGFMPSGLPGFLTSFGLDLLSRPPQGGLLSTVAQAAKGPFQTFQAAQLAERDDRSKRAEDIFSGALASEYDILAKKAGATGDRKTAEVERQIIIDAQQTIFDQRKILDDEKSTDEQKKLAEQQIKIQQNILTKELGTPVEYAAIIGDPNQFSDSMTAYVEQYNQEQRAKQRDYIDKNSGMMSEDELAQKALELFPIMRDGSVKARDLTFEKLKEKYSFSTGGRAGYRLGGGTMMESVVESKKETGEVKDLSYTELRARLPQEISNDIVQLLANSKKALLDFANIATPEDISNFNQEYDVNLTLPTGA